MTEDDDMKALRRVAHLRAMAKEYEGTPQGKPVAEALVWRATDLERKTQARIARRMKQ